jgi:hypothetical protein
LQCPAGVELSADQLTAFSRQDLADALINLAFSVRLAERYRASGGKDDERPNNRNLRSLSRSEAGRKVTLFSRHKKVLNRRFSSVLQTLASFGGDFAVQAGRNCRLARRGPLRSSSTAIVLDGELVAVDSQGKPSFQLMQGILSQSLLIYCYAFDLVIEMENFW